MPQYNFNLLIAKCSMQLIAAEVQECELVNSATPFAANKVQC